MFFWQYCIAVFFMPYSQILQNVLVNITVMGAFMKLKEQKTRSLKEQLKEKEKKLIQLQNRLDEQEMFFAREAKNIMGKMLPFNPSDFKDSNAYYVNQFYRQMIEHLPGHFYWIDKNQYIMGFNSRQAKFFGMKNLSSCYGKHVYDLCGINEESKLIVDNNKEIMTTKKNNTYIESYKRDGERDHYVSVKSPLYDPIGELIGLVGMSINVSEQKKNEERLLKSIEEHEKKHQDRFRMFLDVAHDLRSPFTGLVSLSEHLLLLEKNPEKRNLIAEMYYSSKRSLEFMEELFDNASDFVSGKSEDSIQVFNLNDLFTDVYQMLLPNVNASGKDLNLMLHLPEKPLWIKGRSLMFSRIILNLVANAIKFTREGFVRMGYAAASNINENRKIIKIFVSDTGIGMAAEDLDRIFEDFTILPHEGLSYKSTGLGLGLVNRFLSELGGCVALKSLVGVGTRFTCWLPLEVFKQPDDHYDSKEAIQDFASHSIDLCGRSRVLLIEDELVAQKAAVLMLEQIGCTVTLAGTALEVKEIFDTMDYDIIFIDYCLHGDRGFDLIPALKNKLPSVLVVGLSAQNERHVVKDGFLNGMDFFIHKPITYDKINRLYQQVKQYVPDDVNFLEPNRVICD